MWFEWQLMAVWFLEWGSSKIKYIDMDSQDQEEVGREIKALKGLIWGTFLQQHTSNELVYDLMKECNLGHQIYHTTCFMVFQMASQRWVEAHSENCKAEWIVGSINMVLQQKYTIYNREAWIRLSIGDICLVANWSLGKEDFTRANRSVLIRHWQNGGVSGCWRVLMVLPCHQSIPHWGGVCQICCCCLWANNVMWTQNGRKTGNIGSSAGWGPSGITDVLSFYSQWISGQGNARPQVVTLLLKGILDG